MLFSPVFVTSDPRPLFSAKPLRSWPLRVRSSLNPLECAVPDKHRVLPCFSRNRAHATPLECALARALIHKSFRMRSSEKSGEMGYSRRSLSPKFFPCHTSENSPVSPILATDPKTYLSKSCTCHTSESPPRGSCLSVRLLQALLSRRLEFVAKHPAGKSGQPRRFRSKHKPESGDDCVAGKIHLRAVLVARLVITVRGEILGLFIAPLRRMARVLDSFIDRKRRHAHVGQAEVIRTVIVSGLRPRVGTDRQVKILRGRLDDRI